VLWPSLSLTAKISATVPVSAGTRSGINSGPVTRSRANRSSFALNSPFRRKTRRTPVKRPSLAKTTRCISTVAAVACISFAIFLQDPSCHSDCPCLVDTLGYEQFSLYFLTKDFWMAAAEEGLKWVEHRDALHAPYLGQLFQNLRILDPPVFFRTCSVRFLLAG